MNKKIIGIVCLVVVLIIVFTASSDSDLDESMISQTIFVDAVYEPENNVVRIISSIPQYGWATMPVTFTIEHEIFGKIGLKTEIHLNDEMKPKVIYSKN